MHQSLCDYLGGCYSTSLVSYVLTALREGYALIDKQLVSTVQWQVQSTIEEHNIKRHLMCLYGVIEQANTHAGLHAHKIS